MQKPNWLSENDYNLLCYDALEKASRIKKARLWDCVDDMDIFQISDLLIKIEIERLEKNIINDRFIDYNDEIVSIEEVGEKETIDISVTGDNLFYCNGILTKNSIGLPQTADIMFALISTEELENLNQIMVKQLKNRYNDPSYYKRFVIGVDRARMKLYDVEDSAQTNINDSGNADDTPVFDKSAFGKRLKAAGENSAGLVF
ncbi:MAG: hypothetical protein ACMV1B_01800 [Prevotella sp.]|jgi:hypothetical protein